MHDASPQPALKGAPGVHTNYCNTNKVQRHCCDLNPCSPVQDAALMCKGCIVTDAAAYSTRKTHLLHLQVSACVHTARWPPHVIHTFLTKYVCCTAGCCFNPSSVGAASAAAPTAGVTATAATAHALLEEAALASTHIHTRLKLLCLSCFQAAAAAAVRTPRAASLGTPPHSVTQGRL